MDDFDDNFERVIKLQRNMMIAGVISSLAVFGGLIWAAIHIAGMIWG